MSNDVDINENQQAAIEWHAQQRLADAKAHGDTPADEAEFLDQARADILRDPNAVAEVTSAYERALRERFQVGSKPGHGIET